MPWDAKMQRVVDSDEHSPCNYKPYERDRSYALKSSRIGHLKKKVRTLSRPRNRIQSRWRASIESGLFKVANVKGMQKLYLGHGNNLLGGRDGRGLPLPHLLHLLHALQEDLVFALLVSSVD